MGETNKYHIISMILGLLISMPIWFYLLYKILQFVNATEVMWLLYWIYVPSSILISIISKVADME